MKHRFQRIAAMILAIVMLAGIGLPVSAANEGSQAEVTGMPQVPQAHAETASNTAPEGYVPQNTWIEPEIRPTSDQEGSKKVLLVEDVLPWDSSANQTVLASLTEYTKVTTSGFLNVDLSEYGVIVFANDQPFSTYENYEAFREYMELFASIGGVIVFGACDAGWSDGTLIEALPGGVTKTNQTEHYNYVAAPDHSIVTGVLTDGVALEDAHLVSYYCSHIVFDENSLPPGSTVILRETSTNKPTLVEYPLGKGRVIASGLTWEHNYGREGSSIGNVTVGAFAKTALDDLYKYAIRVSNIDVDEIDLLDDWIVEHNAHAIIAADAGTDITNLEAVPYANVEVDGVSYTADENGTVFCTDYGLRTVKVSAEGYRDRKIFYVLKEKESRIFFLERQKNDGLPYLVQATGSTGAKETYPDLRDQTIHFVQDSKKPLIIYLEADWMGHGAGEFVVYQEATANTEGKSLTIPSGNYCNFMPGMVFAPNKQIKVKMVAADGTVSEPVNLNIIIDKKIVPNAAGSENPLKEGVSKFDWIGNHTVASDNEIFTKLFTTDMSIAGDLLPVEIKIEHNDDGTITYKGIIGLVSGNLTKNILNSKAATKDDGFEIPLEETWDEWKKQIKGFKKAGNPKTYVQNLKKKYGKDWHPSKLRSAGEFDCDVAGYLEFTYDQNGSLVNSEGGLIVEASGKLVIGQTFFAGPVPFYYEFKPGVELKVSGGIEALSGDDGLSFRGDFGGVELALPSISLEGGLGVRGVATAGLEGSGKLVFNFGDNGTTSGKVNLGGAVNIKVIFITEYTWNFWDTEISLWSLKHADLTPHSRHKNAQPKFEVQLASREYLDEQTAWNGSAPLQLMAEGIDNVSLTTLQMGVLPDTMPQIHQVGDQLVMLMLQDDSSRSIGNHTRLMYSVYTDGVWSDPAPVWESETADFFFNSQVIDDQLYVVWQKSDSVMTQTDPEALLTAVAQSSEICMAVFDAEANTFTQQQYITNNDHLDMMATIAGGDGQVVVSWVSNDANNAVGTDGTNTIWQARISNGKVGLHLDKVKTDSHIVELCSGATQNGVELMYAVTEADGTTALHSISGNKITTIKTGTAAASLRFVDGNFLWQENGDIFLRNSTNGNIRTIIEDNASASYRYVSNGVETAIVWTEKADNGSVLMASMYSNGSWCAPITLATGIPDTINFYDVVLMDDGRFAFILNTAVYTPAGLESTALRYAVVSPITEAVLLSAEAEAPDWDNATQKVAAYIENQGNTTISEATIYVQYADEILHEQYVEMNLLPGQTQAVNCVIDLNQLTSVADAQMVLVVEDDAQSLNNSANLTLGHTDIRLGCDVYDRGEQMLFVLSASNQSGVPAQVALSIYEDSFEGIEVDVKNMGQIDPDNSVQYLYAVDKSLLDYDESGRKTYFFKLSTLEADWNEEDNSAFYTIQLTEQEEPDPEGVIQEVILKAPTSVEIQSGDLIFRSVEQEGVQLSAVVRPEDAAVSQVTWTVDNPEVVHITSEGYVTPLRTGVATITASVTDDVYDKIRVIVENPNNPFTDVEPGRFYYDPVLWAVENDITAGMTATTFAPDNQCTRAQVVTFLWRAAGKPEPNSTTHPFVDVKEKAFYYKAMLWAVENGITSGMDATHFAPDAYCSRAQVVTFLYRAKGKPFINSTEHPFTDVSETGFYYSPMLWAIENGITSGMSATTFAPDRICTRGQVVTFLYRAFNN